MCVCISAFHLCVGVHVLWEDMLSNKDIDSILEAYSQVYLLAGR